MDEGRESISGRALRGVRGKPEQVGGEAISASVQDGVGTGKSVDTPAYGQGGWFGNVLRRIRGRYESNSGVPVAPPVGLTKKPSLMDIVIEQRAQLRREFALYAHEHGLETFEEADDFDIPDDPVDPRTPWENDFDLSVDQFSRLDDQKLASLRQAAIAEGKRRDALNRRKSAEKATEKVADPAEVSSPRPA